MANTLATPSWTLKEVGRRYVNIVTLIRNVRRTYSDEYIQAGAKVGDTVKARLPQKFQVTSGEAFQPQDLYDRTVPISLTDQLNVGFKYSSAQATLEVEDVRSRYVNPAADALASKADALAFITCYREVYNTIGTIGAGGPSTPLDYLNAGVKLDDFGAEQSGRVAVLDSYQMAVLANASSTLFNPSAVISENYRRGQFGREQLGISEWFKDTNRAVHTTGTFTASTPLVNGASQTGATLATDGWASGASTLKRGDKFTIAGVYSVNPVTFASTGRLQDFIVTADTSDSAGAMATLPISPSIITSGSLQTVSGSPADNAAITVWSVAAGGALSTTQSAQGLVFVPDAFAHVTADLERPRGGALVETIRSRDANIAMRMVEQYQILTDQNPTRIDMIVGAAAVRPEWAVRMVA